MREARIPGLTISITGPRGNYSRSYGRGRIAPQVPMRATDHVRIASITKTFVATAILQQVDRGRLRLSHTIDRYVRGVPNGKKITIRELLAMRSGIYDFTADPTFHREFERNPLMRFRPLDIIPIIRRHQPLFPPNARTQYADTNYILLGIVLQKVTGRSPESVITRDILRPLRLHETSFPFTAQMPSPFAHGYYAGPNGTATIRDYTLTNPAVPWTAGAMVSSVADMRTWGRALARGTLLSRRLQALRLHFGRIPNPGVSVGYGLGIMRLGNWIGHNGAIFGYTSETFYLPSNGAQIVASGNLSSNSSTPTTMLFGLIAKHLYPGSLGR